MKNYSKVNITWKDDEYNCRKFDFITVYDPYQSIIEKQITANIFVFSK